MDEMMEEDHPLMDEGSRTNRSKNSTRSSMGFCSCFSKKCGVIFLTALVIFHFFFEIIQVVLIAENYYFD